MQNPIDKTSSICKERFSCFIFRIGQMPCRYNIWTENRCSGAVFQCFLQISSGYPDLIPYRIFLSLYTYFPVCIIDFERGVRRCYFYFRNLIPAGIFCITYKNEMLWQRVKL